MATPLFDLPLMMLGLATAVFTLAGVVKGVVGLGLPTVSMALLALLMSPSRAAALLIVPSLVTNVWQLRPWGALWPLLRRLGPMQIGACVGTLCFAWLFGSSSSPWATTALGVALIAYAGWNLVGAKASVSQRTERWLGPLVGLVTGIITAATGVFMVPGVPYLQALGMERDELVQAMGISFTISTIVLAMSLGMNGQYSFGDASISLIMLLPAMVGMALGQSIRHKLSPPLFRKFFMFSIAALGVHMVVG